MGGEPDIGILIAVLSAFFNGSFPVWSKLGDEDTDPVVFNGAVGLGAFFSSLLVPLIWDVPFFVDFDRFTIFGMLGGVLFVGATLCSFVAIPKLGLGIAMAVWSCSAIFVAFFWGVFGPEQVRSDVLDMPLALVSLACLTVGAVVIVSSEPIARRCCGGDANAERHVSFIVRQASSQSYTQSFNSRPSGDGTDRAERSTGRNFAVGMTFALSVGLFGGSVLVPMKFIPEDRGGLKTVGSFGFGAAIASQLVSLLYWKVIVRKPSYPCMPWLTLVAGILSGSTWNAGNICQIIAQSPPISLGYGIAYPVNQCGMLFGGLWGIFVFSEIKGHAVLVFFSGATVLVVGVVLLGLYGPGAG